MTLNQISARTPAVGRPKINHEQMPLRLPEGTLARIDAAKEPAEDRTSFIRQAIEAELKRRARKRSPAS